MADSLSATHRAAAPSYAGRMAGRLIWFFGPSKAGKATLIRAVADGRGHALRTHLKVGAEVEVCTQSLKSGPRDRLADVIADVERDRPGLTQLIKGQSIDIWDWEPRLNTPGDARLQDCCQEVVFVWAHPNELNRRCVQRAEHAKRANDLEEWEYWSSQTEETCRQELNHQLRWVSSLKLPISWVKNDGSQVEIGEKPPQAQVGPN